MPPWIGVRCRRVVTTSGRLLAQGAFTGAGGVFWRRGRFLAKDSFASGALCRRFATFETGASSCGMASLGSPSACSRWRRALQRRYSGSILSTIVLLSASSRRISLPPRARHTPRRGGIAKGQCGGTEVRCVYASKYRAYYAAAANRTGATSIKGPFTSPLQLIGPCRKEGKLCLIYAKLR